MSDFAWLLPLWWVDFGEWLELIVLSTPIFLLILTMAARSYSLEHEEHLLDKALKDVKDRQSLNSLRNQLIIILRAMVSENYDRYCPHPSLKESHMINVGLIW